MFSCSTEEVNIELSLAACQRYWLFVSTAVSIDTVGVSRYSELSPVIGSVYQI